MHGISNKTFEGKVTFIEPFVDVKRSTARVWGAVENKNGTLRPGMFAHAELLSKTKGSLPPLVIPDTAPLFTGRRAAVFVEVSLVNKPTYHAKTVRLGVKATGVYPVIAGLHEGERVVTKGAFALDADLQIQGDNNADGSRVPQWRDHIQSPNDIWNENSAAAKAPGITSAPILMPIGARIVMRQSGMRAPLGIKIQGPSLEAIEQFGLDLEAVLKQSDSIRSQTVFADRVVAKPYIEIDINREAIGRYGLSIADVQEVLQIALGGKPLRRTVEGRVRYGIRVRYMREEPDSIESLDRITVSNTLGQHIPLSQLADIRYVKGPQVIKSEDTFLTSYVLFDKVPTVDEVAAVADAQQLIEANLSSGKGLERSQSAFIQ